jgi:pimeloyl-ACP methyl ester carboxylesterase
MGPYPRGVTDAPAGYVVTVDPGDRIHFLDWGGRPGDATATATEPALPGVLLIHGLSQTAWIWAPVARRLSTEAPTVAMDLRGHGLSDAPTDDGAYDLDVLAEDVIAVAEGSGLLADPADRVVLVGHGFGGIVAAGGAVALGPRCAALVLVDGGWEDLEAASGMEADEFLRGLDEPPEVMRSLRAFLADRRAFDLASWDADQEAAARATVVETHAGRVVPATRPHALEASVRAMFRYDPLDTLARVVAPVTALTAGDDGDGTRAHALDAASAARKGAGRAPIAAVPFGPIGHNLMRYRPVDVTAAILAAVTSGAIDHAPPSTSPAT